MSLLFLNANKTTKNKFNSRFKIYIKFLLKFTNKKWFICNLFVIVTSRNVIKFLILKSLFKSCSWVNSFTVWWDSISPHHVIELINFTMLQYAWGLYLDTFNDWDFFTRNTQIKDIREDLQNSTRRIQLFVYVFTNNFRPFAVVKKNSNRLYYMEISIEKFKYSFHGRNWTRKFIILSYSPSLVE